MTSHYFDESPTTASSPRDVSVVLPDLSFTMTTDRGVFSHDHLDPATKLLLLEAPELPTDGTLLDLGCGVGPMALTMATRRPGCAVWAVDVNERARQLCSANAKRLGLEHISVAAPGDVAPDVCFDVIWSNPPIRIGKAALHELLDTWLARLKPDGHAVLVVSKHLGADSLARWLESGGRTVTRLTSRAGFRLLVVRRAAPPST